MSDPMDPGQGPGGPGFGATGTQPPQTAADARRIADLEAENAKLREERRDDRAKALASQHGLTPTELDLLKRLNADEMEPIAAKLETERKAATPSPAPAPPTGEPAPTSTPAAEPPNAGALAAMSQGGEGAPSAIQTPPANSTEAMFAEINAATSYEEVERIQQKYKRLSLEE